jgi:50S ribosomal protein L16 3-hydroxylase
MKLRTPKPSGFLAHLSPDAFMRRHWQKKPLLVRQALPNAVDVIDRNALFTLACQDGVESRLVAKQDSHWRLSSGPFKRRALPALAQPGWTVLVQGVDLHHPSVHALLSNFRFLPSVRLDDVMVSWASDGGGVGPHVDSYDVFLLQLEGRRRWCIGPVKDTSLVPGLPLKILSHFEPTHMWDLEPGDMLYLPPGWAHDGVAQGPCMTASIGFRAPAKQALGREVLQAMLDGAEPPGHETLYQDRSQVATSHPGLIPPALHAFAQSAIERFLGQPQALACALGEVLSEPKPTVWFEPGLPYTEGCSVKLDSRTRMAYDKHHVFINGESFRASGRDALVMRQLADTTVLSPPLLLQLGEQAQHLVHEWLQAGWLQVV